MSRSRAAFTAWVTLARASSVVSSAADAGSISPRAVTIASVKENSFFIIRPSIVGSFRNGDSILSQQTEKFQRCCGFSLFF